MSFESLRPLITRWRDDPAATLGAPEGAVHGLFLVAPDGREEEVRSQLRRPAFSRVADLDVRYLPYAELERNREAMARFGSGLKAVEAVSRRLA